MAMRHKHAAAGGRVLPCGQGCAAKRAPLSSADTPKRITYTLVPQHVARIDRALMP